MASDLLLVARAGAPVRTEKPCCIPLVSIVIRNL